MTKPEVGGTNLFFGITLPHGINQFDTKLGIPEDAFRRDDVPESDWNVHNYRCDDFSTSHSGKHILFTGCSITYGQGLNKNETWAYEVYDKLNSTEELDGYFNLAMPGTSVSFAIIRLFKYFREFGNPDVVVFNMPPIERFLSVGLRGDSQISHVAASLILDPENKTSNKRFDSASTLFASAIHFELYNMLELYCKEVGIKLISFTWQNSRRGEDLESTLKIFKDFETFYDIENLYRLEDYIFDYIKNNFDSLDLDSFRVPYLVARDESHLGTIYHKFYSDIVLNILDDKMYSQIERYRKNEKW